MKILIVVGNEEDKERLRGVDATVMCWHQCLTGHGYDVILCGHPESDAERRVVEEYLPTLVISPSTSPGVVIL